MNRAVLPRVQAMVLCDAAAKSDLERDVFHLRGVRSVLEATVFPFVCTRLSVFLHMSGHKGNASCHVEISRAETDEIIFRTPPTVLSFTGPTIVYPLVIDIRGCAFPAPGLYYVQVFHERKLIGERPLRLQWEN